MRPPFYLSPDGQDSPTLDGRHRAIHRMIGANGKPDRATTRVAPTFQDVSLPSGALSSDAGPDRATTQYLSKREMGVDIGRATTRAHPPHSLPAIPVPQTGFPYYTTNRPTKPC